VSRNWSCWLWWCYKCVRRVALLALAVLHPHPSLEASGWGVLPPRGGSFPRTGQSLD
jgi:hypothetical protein